MDLILKFTDWVNFYIISFVSYFIHVPIIICYKMIMLENLTM